MKCPECGQDNKKRARNCEKCGHTLRPPRVSFFSGFFSRSPAHRALGYALVFVTCVAGAIVIGLGIYRAYFWGQARVEARLYESGYYQATDVEPITMDNMQVGHVITFYGEDGNSIFIEELRRSYIITGGTVRIEIPDADWFSDDPEEVEAVNVVLTPILTTQQNEKIPLQVVTFTIDVPESPIELINPSTENETVLTSIYKLEFRVVNGSTVIIGGRDLSDLPNEEGVLSANINIYPQGDNLVSVLVKTPHHKEKRVDLVLYRAPQEINLEPAQDLARSTNRKNFKISGKIEPGATLTVDTPHVENSVTLDMLSGTFSFNTNFATVGDNVVTFRAKMDGKQDSVVSLTIYYVPPLEEYDNGSWAMDYNELVVMGDLRAGQKYRSDGTVVAVFEENGEQIVILDVAQEGEDPKLLALENKTTFKTPSVGDRYRTWADMVDRYFYEDKNIPYLIMRYIRVLE